MFAESKIWLSIGKIALFFVLTIALSAIMSLPFNKPLVLPIRIDAKAMLPAVLLTSWLMTRHIESRPFRSLGLAFHSFLWIELVGGIGLGMTIGLLPYLALTVLGLIDTSWHVTGSKFTQVVLLGLMNSLSTGLTEEVVFRGYFLQTLSKVVGVILGVCSSAIVFGLGHAQTNPSLVDLVNFSLMGVLLGAAYMRTKSLWMPIGLHTGFNFMGGEFIPGYSTIVSMQNSPWVSIGRSRTGLLFTVVLLATLVALVSSKLHPHPQMEALWKAYISPAQPWRRLKAIFSKTPREGPLTP